MISAVKRLHISVTPTVQGLIIILKITDTNEIKSIPVRPAP